MSSDWKRGLILPVGMLAGSVVSASMVLCWIAPPAGTLFAIVGAIGGAGLGAILIGPFVHDTPGAIASTSICRTCGEVIDDDQPNCPLCGTSLAKAGRAL